MPSKVLLAGSDQMLQQMAGTFAGGQVHTASTGDGYEAICLLNETIPDLLSAEISLPQKDGYAPCRYVRQGPANQWRRGGQEMVASGEHFGSGAKPIGKGSARAALWAGRKAGSGIRRIGAAIKRIF